MARMKKTDEDFAPGRRDQATRLDCGSVTTLHPVGRMRVTVRLRVCRRDVCDGWWCGRAVCVSPSPLLKKKGFRGSGKTTSRCPENPFQQLCTAPLGGWRPLRGYRPKPRCAVVWVREEGMGRSFGSWPGWTFRHAVAGATPRVTRAVRTASWPEIYGPSPPLSSFCFSPIPVTFRLYPFANRSLHGQPRTRCRTAQGCSVVE